MIFNKTTMVKGARKQAANYKYPVVAVKKNLLTETMQDTYTFLHHSS